MFFSLNNPFSDELTWHMHSGSVTSIAAGLSCHRVKKVRDPLLNLVPRPEHPGGCEVWSVHRRRLKSNKQTLFKTIGSKMVKLQFSSWHFQIDYTKFRYFIIEVLENKMWQTINWLFSPLEGANCLVSGSSTLKVWQERWEKKYIHITCNSLVLYCDFNSVILSYSCTLWPPRHPQKKPSLFCTLK